MFGRARSSTRRRFLRSLGAAGVATITAGCLGSDGGETDEPVDTTVSQVGDGTPTGTTTGTPTATTTATPTPEPCDELIDPWAWDNWENPTSLLRADDWGQVGQIHNPIPILWEGEWYMYAIDGDFSGGWVNTDLYKRADDGSWELFEDNVVPNHEVNDACVVDGIVIAFAGQTGMTVWTGSLTDLTNRGEISLDDGGDPGCFYDSGSGEIHIFYEKGDPPDTSYSGEYIGHAISSGAITEWEEQDPVIDTTDTDFDVGDPRVIRVGSGYHLFVDWNRSSPLERIAHYYGESLDDFERGEVVVAGSALNEVTGDAVISDRARLVGDGAPRYIDGEWKMFYEVSTDDDPSGEIWSVDLAEPTGAEDYETINEREYRPVGCATPGNGS